MQTTCFSEGRALFYVSGVLRLFSMRDINSDFGLHPLPKYDEAQDDYHHTVKPAWASCVCIPKTAGFDDAAFLLEALAAASHDTVKPAYFETTLGTKLMRDERSYDMLDIVMSTRSYAAMTLYNWGGLISTINSVVVSGVGNLASEIDSMRGQVEAAIDETISLIMDD